MRGELDVRHADPYARLIQRRGHNTSKVHVMANRHITGKTKSTPRASVGSTIGEQYPTGQGREIIQVYEQ